MGCEGVELIEFARDKVTLKGFCERGNEPLKEDFIS
jgi:hypothetical protein